MTWTAPRTWQPGELVTANLLNAEIRDHLEYLYARQTIGARIYRSNNQSIPPNTWTPISFSAARYDGDSCFSVGLPTRLSISHSGKYLITVHLGFANTQVRRNTALRVNGGTFIAQHNIESNGVAHEGYVSLATVYPLNPGDYVECVVYHIEASNLDVLATSRHSPEMTLQWLGE